MCRPVNLKRRRNIPPFPKAASEVGVNMWREPRCSAVNNDNDFVLKISNLNVHRWNDGLTAVISCFLVLKLPGCELHNSASHHHIATLFLDGRRGRNKRTLWGWKSADQNRPPICGPLSKTVDLALNGGAHWWLGALSKNGLWHLEISSEASMCQIHLFISWATLGLQ